jgi:hypothetical protein
MRGLGGDDAYGLKDRGGGPPVTPVGHDLGRVCSMKKVEVVPSGADNRISEQLTI